MASLYAKYLMERTDDLILEREFGYCTYRYVDEETVYIVDIFVLQEFRKTHYASDMADYVAAEAKAKGVKKMIGSVVPSKKGATISMKVLLGYGMELDSATNDFIVFKKGI